jgi:hypothetical protein
MQQSLSRFLLIFAILVLTVLKMNGQTTMPEELNKSPMKEQLNYLEERTRIYENYRAIREDMFQKLKENISDTLSVTKSKIAELNNIKITLNLKIDSLSSTLDAAKTSLEDMTRTKNSIKVLGFEVNKSIYNSTLWTIIAGLIFILAIGFLFFKRNLTITINTKKELQELKGEFEAYRKTTREAREKAAMDHFNEVRKLKGG